MKSACAVALEKNLSHDKVAETLVAAEFYRCPELKKECLKRLAEWKDSLDKDKLEILKAYPDLLIDVALLK